MENRNNQVKEFFLDIRKNDVQVDKFFSFLEENNIHHAALGGSVRAAVNNNIGVRDIDIVFQTDDTRVYKFLSDNNISYVLNSMKGLKFTIGEIEFDAWNIENHYAFKKQFIETSFENIYKTALINYDEMVYDFTTNILYDYGYQECLNHKLLKLNEDSRFYDNNPNINQYICKIYDIKQKFQVNLSEKTKDYIKSLCGSVENINNFLEVITAAYKKHYKKDIPDEFFLYVKNEIKSLYSL